MDNIWEVTNSPYSIPHGETVINSSQPAQMLVVAEHFQSKVKCLATHAEGLESLESTTFKLFFLEKVKVPVGLAFLSIYPCIIFFLHIIHF